MKGLLQPPQFPATSTATALPAPGMSPPGASGGAKGGFDINDLKPFLFIAIRRIWLIALCFVIAITITLIVLSRQEPVFRSQATIFLSQPPDMPRQLQTADRQPLDGSYMETQVMLMRQGRVLQQARQRLNVAPAEVQQKVRRIDINPDRRSSFIHVAVESLDAQLAADYANAIAQAYLDFKAEERMTSSQSTVVSLTQHLNRVQEELRRAENAVAEFERTHRFLGMGARRNVASQHIEQLLTQAYRLRNQRMMLEAQHVLLTDQDTGVVLQTLASPFAMASLLGGVSDLPPAAAPEGREGGAATVQAQGVEGLIERGLVDRPNWPDLMYRRAVLESSLADMRTRFQDAHPNVRRAINELRELDRRIEMEKQFAMRAFVSRLESLTIQERAATRVSSAWEEEATENAVLAGEYDTLQARVRRLISLQSTIENRLNEVDITIGVEPENIQITQDASPSRTPMTPPHVRSLFMGALLGLGVGLGLVFGLEFLDSSVRYPEEVKERLGVPFLGVIPAADWDQDDLRSHLIVRTDQKGGVVEAYRNLRSSIMFSLAKTPQERVLAVISAVPLEGKTTTALNLAASLAQAGNRVLLVDADMRRGQLHKFFGLEGGKGLADVLTGQTKPESAVQRTGLEGLDLVATGPFPPNPAELILRKELSGFMDYARRTYDWIVMDCPPVMAVSESANIAALADHTLYVAWAGQTAKKLCQQSLQILRERGARILGCVLNNLELGRAGYYYYYYYSSYYGEYDDYYDTGSRRTARKAAARETAKAS